MGQLDLKDMDRLNYKGMEQLNYKDMDRLKTSLIVHTVVMGSLGRQNAPYIRILPDWAGLGQKSNVLPK